MLLLPHKQECTDQWGEQIVGWFEMVGREEQSEPRRPMQSCLVSQAKNMEGIETLKHIEARWTNLNSLLVKTIIMVSKL